MATQQTPSGHSSSRVQGRVSVASWISSFRTIGDPPSPYVTGLLPVLGWLLGSCSPHGLSLLFSKAVAGALPPHAERCSPVQTNWLGDGAEPVGLVAAASTETVTSPSTMHHQSSLPEMREETQLTSARRLWALLQGGIRATMEKMKKEELKPAQLTHGLQHLRHLSFLQPVRHVAYNSSASLLVVLDAESQLHLHKEDGWLSHSTQAPEPIVGLLYATQVNKYVAWDQSSLQVLGPAFEMLSKVLAPHGIRCCCYSPELNQVVTAGAGSLSVWVFRYGFRQLQCQATVQQGLSPRDTFTQLALDTGVPQTCFAVCGTGVAVFNISQGELLTFQRDLHNRAITDITYCEAGACVVTASRDTTIKVWDKKWLIQTIFVGHTGPVTAVTIYPQGPLILSASQDGTIRTWNLQTIDQVDEVHVAEVVEQLQTHREGGYVVSLTGSTMDLWKVNQLYSLHTRLGAAVTRLCTVDLSAVGSFPVRAVCVCQDSTVRLVAVHTGRILSTLLLDRPCQAVEVAYCLPKETLFVLLELGQLLRVNTAVNPMSIKKMVVLWSESARPCCLLLYSHLVDPEKAYAQWQEIVEQKGDKKAWSVAVPRVMCIARRYLLVLGQEDGSLCVLQWFTGRVQYQVEAHGSERVTALAAYPLDTWIISAGGDRMVKVWRIFPYIDECLTLLLSFSCQHPVLHLCPLGSTLGAAIQDPESATYSIVQYDLLAQSRQEHGPEDDPLDEIVGLCCCPTLKIFASASRDGSVKVWNAQNQLLRHLKLNTIPESLAFGNERGDLLLGVEQHLHRIHHSKYLPRPYLTKVRPELEGSMGRAGRGPVTGTHEPGCSGIPATGPCLCTMSAQTNPVPDPPTLGTGRTPSAGRSGAGVAGSFPQPAPCPNPHSAPAGAGRGWGSRELPPSQLLPRSPQCPLLGQARAGVAGSTPQPAPAPLPTAPPAGTGRGWGSRELPPSQLLPRSPQRPLLGQAGAGVAAGPRRCSVTLSG
uniref:Uncharacterized protein n=1 Tax=Gopherus evgoodei TaxID=1825980 RepID=A0A8C4VGF9_9SAUR